MALLLIDLQTAQKFEKGGSDGKQGGAGAHARDDNLPWCQADFLPFPVMIREHLINVRQFLAYIEFGHRRVAHRLILVGYWVLASSPTSYPLSTNETPM
jgi:hypothetical protein